MYRPVEIYLITDGVKDYGELANFLIIAFVIFKSAKAHSVNETILDAMVNKYHDTSQLQSKDDSLQIKDSLEGQQDTD